MAGLRLWSKWVGIRPLTLRSAEAPPGGVADDVRRLCGVCARPQRNTSRSTRSRRCLFFPLSDHMGPDHESTLAIPGGIRKAESVWTQAVVVGLTLTGSSSLPRACSVGPADDLWGCFGACVPSTRSERWRHPYVL